MDELQQYVKQNLKIYYRPDGRIDYLSLNNDTSIYSVKNKRRVRESLSQVRVKEHLDHSARGSSLQSNSIYNSIESHNGGMAAKMGNVIKSQNGLQGNHDMFTINRAVNSLTPS